VSNEFLLLFWFQYGEHAVSENLVKNEAAYSSESGSISNVLPAESNVSPAESNGSSAESNVSAQSRSAELGASARQLKPVPESLMKSQIRRPLEPVKAPPVPRRYGEYDEEGFELIRPKSHRKNPMPVNANVEHMSENAQAQNSAPEWEGELIRPRHPLAEPTSESMVNVKQIEAEPYTNQTRITEVPNLTDLPITIQRTVPDLSFNSHIYSDEPSARRVMINNLYLREGDEIAGLRIVEIGEYYIHFSNTEADFKLPVLRDWQQP